jgi:hypothetical protein
VASRYNKRVAEEASSSSALPAQGSSSQRRNLLLPADLRAGKKAGACWDRADGEDLPERAAIAGEVDGVVDACAASLASSSSLSSSSSSSSASRPPSFRPWQTPVQAMQQPGSGDYPGRAEGWARCDGTATDLGLAGAASPGSDGATSPCPWVDGLSCRGSDLVLAGPSSSGGQLVSTCGWGLAASLGPVT